MQEQPADSRPAKAPYQQYLDRLRHGEIAYQECGRCAAVIFYPRTICSACGSIDLTMKVSNGLGTVYASTNIHSDEYGIYNVVLVDLEEGVRVMSSLVPYPTEDPVGEAVRLSALPDDEKTVATLVEQERRG